MQNGEEITAEKAYKLSKLHKEEQIENIYEDLRKECFSKILESVVNGETTTTIQLENKNYWETVGDSIKEYLEKREKIILICKKLKTLGFSTNFTMCNSSKFSTEITIDWSSPFSPRIIESLSKYGPRSCSSDILIKIF